RNIRFILFLDPSRLFLVLNVQRSILRCRDGVDLHRREHPPRGGFTIAPDRFVAGSVEFVELACDLGWNHFLGEPTLLGEMLCPLAGSLAVLGTLTLPRDCCGFVDAHDDHGECHRWSEWVIAIVQETREETCLPEQISVTIRYTARPDHK